MNSKSRTSPDPPPAFALDQDFPLSILTGVLARWSPEVRLISLRDVDERLTRDKEDWQVLLGLSQLGYEGLVSLDAGILWLPEVVAMLEQTNMSLVVVEEAGNDPIKATGLLLFHLAGVAQKHRRTEPQLWRLAAREKRPEKLADHIKALEARNRQKFSRFRRLAAERVSRSVLSD